MFIDIDLDFPYESSLHKEKDDSEQTYKWARNGHSHRYFTISDANRRIGTSFTSFRLLIVPFNLQLLLISCLGKVCSTRH